MSTLFGVAAALRCPVCLLALRPADTGLRCDRGHAFDLARQGYASLLAGPAPAGGDTAAMLAARERFLAQGHFTPLYRSLAGLVRDSLPATPRLLIDCGAGTGHLAAALLEALPGFQGLALDLSKQAARRAARRHPRLGALVCDVTGPLPLRDSCAGLALISFAPRPGPELARVLAPAGCLAVITPAPEHLHELRRALGLIGIEPAKLARLDAGLSPWFGLAQRRACRFRLSPSPAALSDLTLMGPSARHLQVDALAQRIAALDAAFPVTAAFEISLYRHRGEVP